MGRSWLLLLTLTSVTVSSAVAQTPSAAGVVVVAQAAHVGSATLTQGTTVFSGDLLKTEDRGVIQVQVKQVSIALGGNSSMRVFRQDERTVVELERGVMTYSAPGAGESITVFAQDVKFVPDTSKPAEGQISVKSRCELTATAARSTLEATSGREKRIIEESKSFSVTSEIGVEYQDSWQPVPADYPEFPRDAQYHHSHGHAACPAAYSTQSHNPIKSPIGDGHFREIAGGLIGLTTLAVSIKALESPHKP